MSELVAWYTPTILQYWTGVLFHKLVFGQKKKQRESRLVLMAGLKVTAGCIITLLAVEIIVLKVSC